ncbi:transglycosylase SLT domain-containing protein [Streptococcus ictaluri]|uniref:Transglycosylase-like domain protein n=1 Tax=Streptococcus ictaluri 707-05 TaxID=764299 RepID=G5K0N0_9STRE|nr:transglycosylase SLT domain-containing protein [Streptococcus ictaluri]EHI70512.1 transglycosylase-like domain protein [Streptococcus ictaluri 707-05]
MFKKENLKQRYFSFGVIAFAIALLAILFAFSGKDVNTDSYAKKPETKVIKEVKKSTKEKKPTESVKKEPVKEEKVQEAPAATPVVEETAAPVAAPAVQEVAATTQYTVTPVSYSNGVVLSNGNTAGAVGSQAAAQMAAATGVSQATWEAIIAQESNGNPNVANPSGASGLFQTMPGWGSTATVQDQINSALNAYNSQGLSAWGY